MANTKGFSKFKGLRLRLMESTKEVKGEKPIELGSANPSY